MSHGLVSHTKGKWVPGILLPWESSKRALSYSRHSMFSLGDEDFFRDPLTVADREYIKPEVVMLGVVCTYAMDSINVQSLDRRNCAVRSMVDQIAHRRRLGFSRSSKPLNPRFL